MTRDLSLQGAAWAFDAGSGAGVGEAVSSLLRSLETQPRLLGLGEPMHGEETFLRLRNRAFQHLVEHHGYRSIAIESHCLAGFIADAYVAGSDAALDEVMRTGITHGFGSALGNRELIEWMRGHNRGRGPAERVRFYGFDAPMESTSTDSPRAALTALRDYLVGHLPAGKLPPSTADLEDLLGDDARWTDDRANMDPSRAFGGTPEAGRLRHLADDLEGTLAAEAPRLIPTSSPDEWWMANLHSRIARGLLRYHAGIAETAPTRVERAYALRDLMMADNLKAIAAREAERGPVLVFAHNGHLQRAISGWSGGGRSVEWWSAGAIAGVELGARYAFLPTAVGAAPGHGLGEPAAGTLEGELWNLPGSAVLDAVRLREIFTGRAEPLTPRADAAANRSYFPLDPAQVQDMAGILFVRRIEPALVSPTG
jgi:erythromycin esterase